MNNIYLYSRKKIIKDLNKIKCNLYEIKKLDINKFKVKISNTHKEYLNLLKLINIKNGKFKKTKKTKYFFNRKSIVGQSNLALDELKNCLLGLKANDKIDKKEILNEIYLSLIEIDKLILRLKFKNGYHKIYK